MLVTFYDNFIYLSVIRMINQSIQACVIYVNNSQYNTQYYNHIMDAKISSSSNADPSTISDVRSWPTSNNPGRCSERHAGSHSKNRDKTTPQKSNKKTKRLNMVINIYGYKKLARKCPRRITYKA